MRAGARRAGLGQQLGAGRPHAGLAGKDPGCGAPRRPAPPGKASARVCGRGALLLQSASGGVHGPRRRFGAPECKGVWAGAGLEGKASASAVLLLAAIGRVGREADRKSVV